MGYQVLKPHSWTVMSLIASASFVILMVPLLWIAFTKLATYYCQLAACAQSSFIFLYDSLIRQFLTIGRSKLKLIKILHNSAEQILDSFTNITYKKMQFRKMCWKYLLQYRYIFLRNPIYWPIQICFMSCKIYRSIISGLKISLHTCIWKVIKKC